MCPDRDSNTHLSVYGMMLQPTEPHQPEQIYLIINLYYHHPRPRQHLSSSVMQYLCLVSVLPFLLSYIQSEWTYTKNVNVTKYQPLSKRLFNICNEIGSTHEALDKIETGKVSIHAACYYQNQKTETGVEIFMVDLFRCQWSDKMVDYVPSKTVLISHLELTFL